MRRISVFISSAMRELEYEREVAEQTLANLNITPILFELFPALSQSPNQAYLEEVRSSDIFVMILWKSLRQAVREEYDEAFRRNKPILILVKSLAENEDRDEDLKDFLNNLNSTMRMASFTRTVYKDFRKIAEFTQALSASVLGEIEKFYKDPIHTLTREEMYELGTSVIKYAQRRLHVYQSTPSLLLGARNYLASANDKYDYEVKFLDAIESWINDNYKIADRKFTLLYSSNAVRKELKTENLSNNTAYVKALKERIKYYDDIEVKSGHRFMVRSIETPISGPLIVGDNRYAIWLLGGDDAVSISQENSQVCDILVRILSVRTQRQNEISEVFSRLDIQD